MTSEAVTYYDPRYIDGLPPDEADANWVGFSADGRTWLLQWTEYGYWGASGFQKSNRSGHPEMRVFQTTDERAFIVKSLPLPVLDT